MASIKKRPGSGVWVACYTLPDGSRKQVSTHTKDENEALQIALGYEKVTGMARKRRLTQETAKRAIGQIAALAGVDMGGETSSVRQFIDKRLAALKSSQRGRTLEKYEHHLELFRDKSGLADEPMEAVTQARASDWRDKLLARGLAGATANQHLRTLRVEFGEAVQREMIPRNPFATVFVKGAQKQKQRRDAFTFGQFSSLLDALELADCPEPHADEWRALVILAGYSGQRKNDCVNLAAEMVDTRRGVIRFWRSKNKSWHEVPIHPALMRALSPILKGRPKGALFPNLASLPPRGRSSVTDTFRQHILPLIGINQPYAHAGESRGRKIASLSFHSLRHGLSTWLNTAGVSQVDRAALVGHEDTRTSDGYTHAGFENAKRAIALIPEPEKKPPP